MNERLLVLAVVFTMALGLSLTLAPGVLPFYAIALAVLACAAVPYLLHSHPSYTFSPLRMILPAAIALVAPSIAHDLGSGPFRLVAVFGPGALLYGVIYAEYLLIRPSAELPVQAARLLTYEQKERSVISGPLVAAASAALALRLLSLDHWLDRKSWWYAGVAGLAMAEALWPLNYWTLGVAAGGLALLLVFYVLVGVMRQLLSGELSRSILLEYGSVSLAGIVIVFAATRLQ